MDFKAAFHVSDLQAQVLDESGELPQFAAFRGRVDAVMVGVGTVIADDPQLTARLPDGQTPPRIARRVVVDRSGRMPVDAKLLHDNGPPVTVLNGDLRDGLKQLADEGATNVLVE
ncbi:MAG: dihydrofolate reductase family protein, partial [Planctomycetota bacterium]